MKRREFIGLTLGAAAAAALPAFVVSAAVEPVEKTYRTICFEEEPTAEEHPPYWCDCGRVQYSWRPEGHYAASYIFIDDRWQRFNYALWRRHEHIHRKMAGEQNGPMQTK